jgi:hypothetical protein
MKATVSHWFWFMETLHGRTYTGTSLGLSPRVIVVLFQIIWGWENQMFQNHHIHIGYDTIYIILNYCCCL